MRRKAAAFLLACALPAGLGCHRKAEKPAPPIGPPVAATAPATCRAADLQPPRDRSQTGRAAIRHVVIISEDGLRPDALTGVNPPVHEAILKRAAYSLRARTIRRASTLPSHAAMLSGFDIKEHGLYWNSWHPERGYIHVPTVFDAAKASGGESAAFVGKRKLEHIARPGADRSTSSRGPATSARRSSRKRRSYFVEKKPEIEFIHFSDPDDLGHSDGWMSNPQLEAVRQTDKCLATLLDAGRRLRTRSRDALHHLGRPRRPRPQPRRQDRRGPPDPLDRVGPRHPRRPPHPGRHQHRRHRRHRPLGPRLCRPPPA